MVVTHPTQGETSASSATARKNRRRVSRKAPRTADLSIPPNTNEDEMMGDADADADAETSTSGPTNKAIPPKPTDMDDDTLMIDTDPTLLPQTSTPAFPPLAPNADKTKLKSETRRIPIPPHRMTPLKKDWINIFGPLTEILGLQVRMNVQRRCVEARVCAILRLFDAPDESFRHQNSRRISELYRKVQIS
jgi:RNA-binding protein PNO1